MNLVEHRIVGQELVSNCMPEELAAVACRIASRESTSTEGTLLSLEAALLKHIEDKFRHAEQLLRDEGR